MGGSRDLSHVVELSARSVADAPSMSLLVLPRRPSSKRFADWCAHPGRAPLRDDAAPVLAVRATSASEITMLRDADKRGIKSARGGRRRSS